MAEEVPISDVLCEAMEYLSKLGSNLRLRSDALKEKRIRKDKLRNSHAVQKAANKVLLICQLSKKSLENVESGVKKVLDTIGASQASIECGEESSSSHKNPVTSPSAKKPSYHYFEYNKRKLKIVKKISFKHYSSVKVLAKKMPISMQDKYPVYHDCKLYRLRKKKAHEEKPNKEQSDESDTKTRKTNNKGELNEINEVASQTVDSDSDEALHTDNKLISDSDNDKPQVLDKNTKNKLVTDSDNNTTDAPIETSSKEETNTSQNKMNKRKLQSDKVASDSETDKNNCEELIKKDQNKIAKNKSGSEKILSDSDSDKKSGKKENKRDKKPKNISVVEKIMSDSDSDKNNCKLEPEKSKKKRKVPVISDDSDIEKASSQDNEVVKNIDSDNKNTCKDDARSESDNDTKEIHKESKCKKSKTRRVRIVSDDDSSSEKSQYNNEKTHNKLSKSVNQESSEKNNAESSDENQQKDAKHSGTDEKKPLLKLVNINKLLKPDLVKDSEPNKELNRRVYKNNKNTNDTTHTKKRKEEHLITRKDDMSSKKGNDCKTDEAFWAVKRKEVEAFKAKECSVNIARLPVVLEIFLLRYNLKKITKNCTIICEIIDDISVKNATPENDTLPDIENVKNALLRDSDSDKSESSKKSTSSISHKTCTADTQNTTQDGENDVYTEKEKSRKEISGDEITLQEKAEDLPLDISKDDANVSSTMKDKNDRTKNIKSKKNEEKKSSLLNDSSSDSEKSSNKNNISEHNTNDDKMSEKDSGAHHNLTNEDPEKVKSYLLEDTSSGSSNNSPNKQASNEKRISPDKDPDKIKSALLNDSSSESQKSTASTNLTKPIQQSKRKHIMESMHAKKMLLTYSSSSETEDEKLNNVMKNLKDELLKEKSTEQEDELKKACHKKKRSSDSDGEVTEKRVRKKRKIELKKKSSGSKSSSSDQDAKKTADEPSSSNQVDKTNSSDKKMGGSGDKSGSSSHNSDTQDDKVIDGLTNLNSLNKTRRRKNSSENSDRSSRKGSSENSEDSSRKSSRNSEGTSGKKKLKMPKTPLITGEGLLEAPSSSEEDTGAESDQNDEELPPIKMTGLNGDGMDHLAKDDLLDESDASKMSEDKKDTTDTDLEENVKTKRRKAHAISSDSEAGSSRRKDADRDARLSDFEDSEDESSDQAKKNKSKRKKKANDSDLSADSSSEGKKKRRRIKQIDDSDDDGTGSESETEGRNKHGRKNIRKVMGKNQLEEATKKAAREEKERLARILERQKIYNNVAFDESGKPDEVVVDKVVLDFDPETKEPLIEVDRGLVKKLKPHQANGIKFMWDACFESVKRIKKDRGSGCILAHCMGLGKTLQVVSLTHTLLTHGSLTGVERVLVVCPLSTVLNWVNEFRMWLKHAESDYDLDIYELSRYKQNSERAFQLSQWFTGGGVCVLGYEMFRNLSADNPKKFKKKMLRNFQESLVDPGPDLVVCDEGHLLKNEKTSLSQSMNRVRTRRRIVLTGTPLQNNLKEYYCMVQFVKPNLLGKYNEYLNRFVNPITNGQYTDSTEHDIRVMKRRSHVLHTMLDGAVQRRDYGVLAPFLPPKHEYVLFITLSEVQIKLYQHYLDNYSRRPLPGKSSGFLFPDFQSLQRIWTHPLVLKYNSERYEIMQQKKREREEEDSEGSLVDFIDDDSTPEESSTEESSDDLSDASDDSRKKSKKKKSGKKSKKDSKVSTRRGTRANPTLKPDEEEEKVEEVLEVKNDNPTEWWIPLVTDDEIEDMRNSHKLVLLFEILRQCEAIGDKLLVFSQSLYSLDLIEHFLGKVDEATQEGRIDEKLGGHVGSWSPGVDYFRLDGSTSCENRSIWCKNFNREDNPRARLFLISTRAGGLGINLVAANRVVIFDVSWNPSHDVQSIFRVYRFGQKKPCYIYRFLAMGTMEEKIYERQVTKQAISKRVIDEQQIDRHYAENDLAELYKFEPRPPAPRPVPLVPKDRLFAEMLKEHNEQIYKFHEHDSLLENKEEETLTEEERKAAWEDFENEKNRPPPVPFSAWPQHNGLVPNLLAQQQQQLAYAALASMLRKDMPNISEEQIRNMLPLIYGANPALMQKLSELYKYPQSAMMNPALMNSMMNPGSGMGGGGTSGLQYEPPWAREMQQQNQMRLQQMMQHQNQMGAKYYAGGLGSRDPVAMALQQQRAREIMVGDRAAAMGGAGRPRGRPPLQPRAPPAHMPHNNDVVNLDSD